MFLGTLAARGGVGVLRGDLDFCGCKQLGPWPTDIAEPGAGHAELLGADETVTAQLVTAIN